MTVMRTATRVPLPPRRHSVTQKATVGGVRTYLTVGFDQDHAPRELFLTVEGAGAEQRMLYDVIARCVSVGLQYGIPLDEYVDLFLGVKSADGGPVRHHPRLRMATSVLDYVARELAISYLGRDELAHQPKGGRHGDPADRGG